MLAAAPLHPLNGVIAEEHSSLTPVMALSAALSSPVDRAGMLRQALPHQVLKHNV